MYKKNKIIIIPPFTYTVLGVDEPVFTPRGCPCPRRYGDDRNVDPDRHVCQRQELRFVPDPLQFNFEKKHILKI